MMNTEQQVTNMESVDLILLLFRSEKSEPKIRKLLNAWEVSPLIVTLCLWKCRDF